MATAIVAAWAPALAMICCAESNPKPGTLSVNSVVPNRIRSRPNYESARRELQRARGEMGTHVSG